MHQADLDPVQFAAAEWDGGKKERDEDWGLSDLSDHVMDAITFRTHARVYVRRVCVCVCVCV